MTPVIVGIKIPPKNRINHIRTIKIGYWSINGTGKATAVHKNPLIVQNKRALSDSIPPTLLIKGALSRAPARGPVIEHSEYQNVTCLYVTPMISKK